MWGWVPERPPTALEEEEEEMTEPPRAMEEEEEEEDEEEDEEEEEEEEDDYKNGNGDSGHVPQRRPQNPKRVSATHRSRAGTSKSASMAVKRHAKEEEEEEDSSSYQSSKKKRPSRSRVPAVSGPKRRKDDDDAASDDQGPLNRKKGAKSSTIDDEEADGFDEHEGANGDDNTDSETEPSKPPAAPLSPAKLTSGNNPAGPTTSLSALAAVADGINPSSGPNGTSASATSSSVIAALSLEQLSNHIPRRSRSDSAGSAESINNAGSSKSKPKAPKINSKVNKSKPRGKLSPTDKKDMTLQVNGTTSNGDFTKSSAQSSAPAKKAPPPPLDLKIDTLAPSIVVTTNGQDMDVDGEEEATDTVLEDGMDIDAGPTPREPEEEEEEEEEEDVGDDGDDVSAREEEDIDPIDEEAGDVGEDADEEPLDGDEDPADNDGEDEQDQEQDHDPEGVDVEQENEEGDQEEADEEVSPGGDADVEDHEGDMQPAHRAEALDVLARIELRFALLRERVYVEKMESLAWEESMVQNGVHPEMIHLQKELSKRRDKRLELASRKRSYEVANATTRRKADEAGLWSWWKAAKTTLQTDMISETSRKRRKLERERRASERPPPSTYISYFTHICGLFYIVQFAGFLNLSRYSSRLFRHSLCVKSLTRHIPSHSSRRKMDVTAILALPKISFTPKLIPSRPPTSRLIWNIYSTSANKPNSNINNAHSTSNHTTLSILRCRGMVRELAVPLVWVCLTVICLLHYKPANLPWARRLLVQEC
jgi:hypothetical protein